MTSPDEVTQKLQAFNERQIELEEERKKVDEV